ncbi:hypothetical protein F5Y19DRAFT_472991 [Xylariaceae sp. FL1651]|nr:hypothetical protein F5Y19DRAFT_472991 [Xylariaceae sp. FL1651]
MACMPLSRAYTTLMARHSSLVQYSVAYLLPIAFILLLIVLIENIATRRANSVLSIADDNKKMKSDTPDTTLLPSGTATEVEKVAKWLLSDDAKFETVNGVKICKNTDGLVTATADLLKQFAAGTKV